MLVHWSSIQGLPIFVDNTGWSHTPFRQDGQLSVQWFLVAQFLEVFLSHGGTPLHHPVVMDDHDFVFFYHHGDLDPFVWMIFNKSWTRFCSHSPSKRPKIFFGAGGQNLEINQWGFSLPYTSFSESIRIAMFGYKHSQMGGLWHCFTHITPGPDPLVIWIVSPTEQNWCVGKNKKHPNYLWCILMRQFRDHLILSLENEQAISGKDISYMSYHIYIWYIYMVYIYDIYMV